MPQMHREDMKRFITHVMKLSGETRTSSQAGQKMSYKNNEEINFNLCVSVSVCVVSVWLGIGIGVGFAM